MIYFTWDQEKAESNLKKHGVSFEEAESVFDDPNGLLLNDESCDFEERYVLLGFSSTAKMFVVAHCYRETDNELRIISARKATKHEHHQYIKRFR